MNKEKLRQREGWFHWVVAAQEGSSSPAAYIPPGGGSRDGSIAGEGLPSSVTPSEASDSVMVSISLKISCVMGVLGYSELKIIIIMAYLFIDCRPVVMNQSHLQSMVLLVN